MLLLFTLRAIKELKCWCCFTSFSNLWTLSSLVCVFVRDFEKERDMAFSLHSLRGTSLDCVRRDELQVSKHL